MPASPSTHAGNAYASASASFQIQPTPVDYPHRALSPRVLGSLLLLCALESETYRFTSQISRGRLAGLPIGFGSSDHWSAVASMAEGRMDLARIALLKTDSEVGSGKGLKGNPSGVLDVEKVMVGFGDEPKDQLASENSIPLSPQWLYSRHSENKVGNSAASGDTRPPNSLPHGTSTDSVQRDSWRLDGPPERKEWRRNVPDVENSRWRDEERETSLLGRRECRKEGDRESEFRKNERRSENISTRDTCESRNLPSLDRWHEASIRNTENRHENQRDSKWSSRWGPEDKDSRADRKMDADKEDQFAEKQSLGSSRLLESDSRDKWRPRHRLELHSAAPTVYRATQDLR